MPPHHRESLLPAAISALVAGAALTLSASPAAADEIEVPQYREDGPAQLVCIDDAEAFAERNGEVAYNQRLANQRLFDQCAQDGHRTLGDAITAAEPGSRILILPGRYGVEQTILVDGADDLQIEGLGDGPEDVHFSAGYGSETVIQARDSTGLYLKGFTVTGATGSGLTLDGVAGAMVEQVASTRNGRNGIRVSDSETVRLAGCAASANDHAGIAVDGSRAEVSGCDSSGNLIGLLKTGGGETLASGNRLHGNTTGLVVSGTGSGHRLEAEDNAVYGNNADHYSDLPGACERPLSERDWADGALCPDSTAPVGVGILVDASSHNRFRDNTIWGQHTAAAMVWGETGLDDEVSDNRFEGNTLGRRDDGQRSRNRLDLWWDGQGGGNCFDEPDALHTTPAVLPSCDSETGPDRMLSEPVKTLKIWQCGAGPLDAGSVPTGCDWYGAQFTDRLEFQTAVLFAAGMLFLTGAGWLGAARSPNPPAPMSMTFSAIATGAGALLMVLASWSGRSDYEALAIGLWGLGWVLAGRSWFSCGLGVFGGFTSLIGGLAVLDAIDRGVWMVPVVPFAPAWMWLVLLPLWLLLALAAVFRPRRREPVRPPVQRTPATVPVYNRFDW